MTADISVQVDPGKEARYAAWRRLCGLVPRLEGTDGLSERLRHSAGRRLDDLFAEAASHDALAAQARSLADALGRLEEERRSAGGRGDYPDLLRQARQAAAIRAETKRIREGRLAHYRTALGRDLPRLANSLREQAGAWSRDEERMRDFFGSSRGLWDLEPGSWRKIDWSGLEEAAACLAEWPELDALAELLGRVEARRAPEPPPAAAERAPQGLPEHHVDAIGRSEITGFTIGRDLGLLPAFELALLADPATEGLFLKRHAEGVLTNLEYKTIDEYWITPAARAPEAPLPEPAGQGPVIICADTSGSMAGWPERAAKALTLALARRCLASGRGCYLIGFSSGIHCFDLSDPARCLAELSDFLIHGFHGGTDLRPALARSLELLDNPVWTRADLLVISDFRVPKLMIKKSSLIDPIRARHAARLHAVTVSPAKPSDDLNIFDTAWHFRIGPDGRPLGIGSDQFRAQKSFFALD